MRRAAFVVLLSLLAGGLLLARSAHAWVDLMVGSDNIVIDVERAGAATVRHEVLLRVRGGPLKSMRIVGVDADAQLIGDATFARAASGRAAGPAMPLAALVEGGDLHLSVEGGNRIGSGQYLLSFAYRTDLSARNMIVSNGKLALLRWVGPRFEDGIDSVRVLFRFPHGAQAPHVPDADAVGAQLGIVAEYDGVFLSDYRRADDKDELEVVRPHVAKGEPVVWRARVDANALGLASAAQPVIQAGTAPAVVGEVPQMRNRRARTYDLWLVALSGLLYTMLVLFKSKLVARATAARGVAPRPLVPWGAWTRAVLAGAALSGATALLLLTPLPLLAVAPLLLAIAFAVHLTPSAPPIRRGPGNWRSLGEQDAFRVRREPTTVGSFLDLAKPLGFCVFAVVMTGLFLLAASLFTAAAVRGASVLTQALALIPIFATGRAAQLPVAPVARARSLLKALCRRLRREPGLQVSVLGRIPQASDEPDELRLLVMPQKCLLGLNAIEVACELSNGFAGPMGLPVVLVRANEGSPGYEALPGGVVWVRGRTASERACVLRPRIPTVGNTLVLLRQLCERLSSGRAAAQRGNPDSARAPASSRRSAARAGTARAATI